MNFDRQSVVPLSTRLHFHVPRTFVECYEFWSELTHRFPHRLPREIVIIVSSLLTSSFEIGTWWIISWSGKHTHYYPARMHRGKVISLSVCLSVCLSVIVVTTKITRSQHLGTWATRKYNEFVEVGEKLAPGCLESCGTALQASQIVYLVGYHSHTHRPCPLCICM